MIYNDFKLGADNPSLGNFTNLGQSLMSIATRFGRIFEAEKHSKF
jgi:hypothetical protein